jgi:hypothetical protein
VEALEGETAMSIPPTQHCPHCESEINAQHTLPPISSSHTCTGCGYTVIRTPASIRDAWRTFALLTGALPLWALVFFTVHGAGDVTLGAALISSFFIVFPFGLCGLMFAGWVVGAFVAAVAARPAPARQWCSASQRSASRAAWQPLPAAVTACR